jgi:hypothetical protein
MILVKIKQLYLHVFSNWCQRHWLACKFFLLFYKLHTLQDTDNWLSSYSWLYKLLQLKHVCLFCLDSNNTTALTKVLGETRFMVTFNKRNIFQKYVLNSNYILYYLTFYVCKIFNKSKIVNIIINICEKS